MEKLGKVLLACLFSYAVVGQQINLELQDEIDCNNSSLCIKIVASSADGSSFGIGTSSVFMTYNKDVLQFDSYTSENFNGSDLCIADAASAWDEHDYDAMSVLGELNMTMNLLNSEYSCPSIGQSDVVIGEVCFNIIDIDQDPQVKFNLKNTNFNSAIYNDGSAAIAKGTFSSFDTDGLCNNVTLPITWLDIQGVNVDGYNLIEWQVNEVNEATSFEVLRMNEITNEYISIGNVLASDLTTYHFKDYDIDRRSRHHYYKIRLIDIQSSASYSDQIIVHNNSVIDIPIDIYPNPTKGLLNVDIVLDQKEDIQFSIYNVQGQVVHSKSVSKEVSSTGSFRLDVDFLSPGVYYLETISFSVQDLQQIIILE